MKARYVVSSKSLASVLNSIDLDAFPIIAVELRNDLINLHTSKGITQLSCVSRVLDFGLTERQNIRWDWVKKLMNQIDEQPLVLDIKPDSVDVIFQY